MYVEGQNSFLHAQTLPEPWGITRAPTLGWGPPWHRSILENKILLEGLSHDTLNLLCDVKMLFNFY